MESKVAEGRRGSGGVEVGPFVRGKNRSRRHLPRGAGVPPAAGSWEVREGGLSFALITEWILAWRWGRGQAWRAGWRGVCTADGLTTTGRSWSGPAWRRFATAMPKFSRLGGCKPPPRNARKPGSSSGLHTADGRAAMGRIWGRWNICRNPGRHGAVICHRYWHPPSSVGLLRTGRRSSRRRDMRLICYGNGG